jgi:hypothetical protein
MDQQPKTRQESKKNQKHKAHPNGNPYTQKFVRHGEKLAEKKRK